MEKVKRTSTSPLRVLIYDKDPGETWVVRELLRQRTDMDINIRETDNLPDVKIALDRGNVDLVLVGMGAFDASSYWLGQILENQLGPVVMLTDGEETPARQSQNGPIASLPKRHLSREELFAAMDRAVSKWQAHRRGLAHRDELDRYANRDSLTGVLSRQAVLNKLDDAMSRARRYGEELCLAIFDVDNLRHINETAGQMAGDRVLLEVGTLIRRKVREADTTGRYGGDEFLVVLPHTGKPGATIATDRIRACVEAVRVKSPDGSPCPVTVSGGLAQYEPGDDVPSMTFRAETLLCRAKDNGRNRTES